MPRTLRRRTKKLGLPPGTLVYTGEQVEGTARITVIEYDEQHYEERELDSLAACPVMSRRPTVTWINVSGISQVTNLEKLGECFKLHPLVLEDIVSVDQRPKIEDYEEYLFIVLRAIGQDDTEGEIFSHQISIILGPNYVLSFQESNGSIFSPVREWLKAAKGRIRKSGADYLAYALIDLVVDQYFVVLEKVAEDIELLEGEVVTRPNPRTLRDVHRFKNDMITLRRSLWPLREVIARLERRESELIEDATSIYFKDVYDHTIIAIDSVETYRDILSGMLDIYLSSVSNRLNEIMKVLTIIATIFMPLTFIVGLYGMNFKYMPELEWRYGYFLVLLVIVGIAGSMLVYFKRKKWI
jgi:magnesium transporter